MNEIRQAFLELSGKMEQSLKAAKSEEDVGQAVDELMHTRARRIKKKRANPRAGIA